MNISETQAILYSCIQNPLDLPKDKIYLLEAEISKNIENWKYFLNCP